MDKWNNKIIEISEQAKKIKRGYAEEWLNQIRLCKNIYIFGAGEHGICWYYILKKCNVNVNGFCDNDKNMWGGDAAMEVVLELV